jgi:Arc/MetJ family transcription regulator
MGRFTVMIDDKLLDEAQSALSTRTKRETIETALREVVRRAKARKALEHKGKLNLGFSREDLLRRRAVDN